MVIWARGIAPVEKLTRNGVGAVRPRWQVGSFVHREDGKFRVQLERQLRLQLFDFAAQVSNPEELTRIDGATLQNIIAIHVHQAARSQIDSATGKDMGLDS